jgi:hypothetical protein
MPSSNRRHAMARPANPAPEMPEEAEIVSPSPPQDFVGERAGVRWLVFQFLISSYQTPFPPPSHFPLVLVLALAATAVRPHKNIKRR